nr:carbon starvation protein A [Actinomycetota bacterium]
FGTTNQLTAGLALTVVAVWVTKRGRNPIAVIIPLVLLLVMTSWALVVNLLTFIEDEQWVLAPLDAIIFVLAMWLIVEAALALRGMSGRGAPQAADAPRQDDPVGGPQR